MADQQPNDRDQQAAQIEAAGVLAEMDKHEKATKVADGLQSTRAARDEVRRGGKN